MISTTFRTDDGTRWGAGKRANLDPVEIDRNFWELKTAFESLLANPPSPIEIASFGIAGVGMTITMTNGSTVGPLPLPVLAWRWRDAWIPNVPYLALDIFMVAGLGLFLVMQDHTSAATFDPAATSGGMALYLQLLGTSGAGSDAVISDPLAAGCSMDWGLIGAPVSAAADWGLIGTPVTVRIDLGLIGE